MSEKNGSANGNGDGKPDVAALRAEIKQTRAELGETVQALAAKADVKARAKEQVEATKQRVRAQAAEATGKVRDAAQNAARNVRSAAEHGTAAATDSVRAVAPDGDDIAGAARRIPVELVVASVAALVGIILLVRGSRR